MNLPVELVVIVLEKYIAQHYQGYTFYKLPHRIKQIYDKLDCWELLEWDENNMHLVIQWDCNSALEWLDKSHPPFKQLFKRDRAVAITDNLRTIRFLIRMRGTP